MNELDKWSAEAVGITDYRSSYSVDNGYKYGLEEWTLSDARCMEIFREKFKVETETFSDIWQCYVPILDEFYEGNTIKEAELACARAIMEASK